MENQISLEPLRGALVSLLLDFYYGDEHGHEGLPKTEVMAQDYAARLLNSASAKALLDSIQEEIKKASKVKEGDAPQDIVEAIRFYADPGTYHATSFMFDRPTGGFDEDFSEDHGDPHYDYAKPGKLARQLLSKYDRPEFHEDPEEEVENDIPPG